MPGLEKGEAGRGSLPQTEGVKILLGDPKQAVIRLSVPMILAMGITSLYNLVDSMWVSGLGEESLSAVGYYFPLMMLAVAFATGLGVGGGAAVSRAIGARRPGLAASAAVHTLLFGLLVSLVFTFPFIIWAKPIFILLGVKTSLEDALSYGTIMFGGTVFLFFTNIAAALLRGEGSAKKAMYSMAAGALLNVGLDPLFIYGFGLKVAGAAWASVISMALSSLPLVYWLFFDKKRYVRFNLRGFRPDGRVLREIAAVGIPTLLMQGAMSVMMSLLTVILSAIGKDRAVAVFNSGWKVVMVATLPLIGMATAVTSVAAASFGAREYGKLKVIHAFAFKLGLGLELAIALLTALAAPLIAQIFTWSPKTAHLAPDIASFLRVIWIFYPAVAGGMLSSALFQGVRKGLYSLVITVLRTVVLAVPSAYLLGVVFGLGEPGVYVGMIIASWLSSIIAFTWVRFYLKRLADRGAAGPAEGTPVQAGDSIK